MTRPAYIQRGGDLALAPPLALRGATMYSFLVGAKLDALTALLDHQLNAVSQPFGTIYRPLLPMAAIVCADVKTSFSTSPPDAAKGCMGERDFGVWIPVAACSWHGDAWRADRMCWYLPYVFVDNVAAMVTGREVYGFFKQTAQLAMPPSPAEPGEFTVDALAIEKFSKTSMGKTERLLTITPDTSSDHSLASTWNHASDAVKALIGGVESFLEGSHGHDRDGHGEATPGELVKDLLTMLITGNVPLVFLKQLRDAADADKACYQAVIEAAAHLDEFHGGGVTHPHRIQIAACDSHPIVSDCGLASHDLRAELGFWCQMDFTMKPGQVIAQAT